MSNATDATLLVLTAEPLDVRAASALQTAAAAMGHETGCRILQLAEAPDFKSLLFELDPWSVIAVDQASADALRDALAPDADALAPDNPISYLGYALVLVPDFAACLDDLPAKRIAWERMKAAAHPGNPLD